MRDFYGSDDLSVTNKRCQNTQGIGKKPGAFKRYCSSNFVRLSARRVVVLRLDECISDFQDLL